MLDTIAVVTYLGSMLLSNRNLLWQILWVIKLALTFHDHIEDNWLLNTRLCEVGGSIAQSL